MPDKAKIGAKDETVVQKPKKPRRRGLWICIVILLLIVGGITAFELGKSANREDRTDQKSVSSTTTDSSTKKGSSREATQSSSSSVSSKGLSSSSSSTFQLTYQNTTAAGWNAAATYYAAHALGYSEILPDLSTGSFELHDTSGVYGMPAGDDGHFFVYHFGNDRSEMNEAVYMGFTFTGKQINYYEDSSMTSPAHTATFQQVLDYINGQNAGQQVENLTFTYTN